jgi:hypothetical protein
MTPAPVELCCSSALAAEGGAAVCLLIKGRIISENGFSHKKAQKAQNLNEVNAVQRITQRLSLKNHFVLFMPFCG